MEQGKDGKDGSRGTSGSSGKDGEFFGGERMVHFLAPVDV